MWILSADAGESSCPAGQRGCGVGVFEALEAGDPRQVGRYRIVARLGAGGMGRVYLGRSPGGRAVAVKVVRPELAEDAEFRRRFAREVAAARRVNGAFTAGVVDADPEGSPAWLATVYVPGPSLGEAVAAHGPWPQEQVLSLGAGLAEGLEVIHAAGVVHRDLKPSNVLLAADGPRVIDFGISLAGEASVLTRTGTMPGTPGFMSPEQLTARPVGPACDVFALGAVLVFAATGAGPFGTGSGHVLNFRTVYEEPDLSALPAALRAVVARCLAKGPGERPGPAELLDLLAGAPRGGQATPVGRIEAEWMPEDVARTVQLRTTALSPAARPEEDRAEAVQPVAYEPEPASEPETAGPVGVSRRRALLGLTGAVAAGGLGVVGWYFVRDDDAHKPKWTFTTGGANYAKPLVSDGVVYVSGGEASLYAVDAATGRQRWKFRADEAADAPSSLAMSDGVVYVCGGKHLHAVDAASGKQRWTFATSGDVYAPAAGDGLVYFNSSDYLYAVDAAEGKQRWKFRTDATVLRVVSAVSGGVVYVGNLNDELLYALDATTGEPRWKTRLATLSGGPAVVVGGTVYLTAYGGQLFAVNAADGKQKWVLADAGSSSVAVSGGQVYVGGGKHLHAVDAVSGKERWIFPVGSALSGPAVSEGVVYVATASNDKYLYAVDAASGEQRWRYPTQDAATTPVVSNGLVYVSSFHRLYAFRV